MQHFLLAVAILLLIVVAGHRQLVTTSDTTISRLQQEQVLPIEDGNMADDQQVADEYVVYGNIIDLNSF